MFDKVKSGQQFEVKAAVWNGFIDAANYVQNNQISTSTGESKIIPPTGVILIKNSTGSTIPQFGLVVLTDIIIKPNSEKTIRSFKNDMPLFDTDRFSESNKTKSIAIAQEPIKDGLIGKAILMGITACKINVDNTNHTFAVPDKDNAFKMKSASTGDLKILWKQDGTGEKFAMVAVGLGTIYDYRGMFKLTLDGSSIKIANGDDSQGNAGFVMINGEYTSIANGSLSSTSGYVCIKATVNSDGYTTAFEITSEPKGNETTGYYVLGYVKASTGGGQIDIIQYNHSTPHILIVGNCKSAEATA